MQRRTLKNDLKVMQVVERGHQSLWLRLVQYEAKIYHSKLSKSGDGNPKMMPGDCENLDGMKTAHIKSL